MILTLTPEQVLDTHAGLTERMCRPSPAMADFLAYHMSQAREMSQAGVVSMFHPVIPYNSRRPVTGQDGAAVARLIGKGLREAVTYQVTAAMVADMRAVYDNAMAEVEQITAAEVPCDAGFAWLDESWQISSGAGAFRVRALSWEYTEIMVADAQGNPKVIAGAGKPVPWPCVRVSLWRHDADVGAAELDARLGPVVLTHTMIMPLSLPFTKATVTDEKQATDSFLGLIHLLWIFLGMELTSQAPARIKNHYRKRALRTLRHAQVRVVLLRRIRGVTEPGPGEHRDVFWSCRWPVQGHYRHREAPEDRHRAVVAGLDKHCAVCGGGTAYVRPYLKGPDGLPLRVTDRTLMKLARLPAGSRGRGEQRFTRERGRDTMGFSGRYAPATPGRILKTLDDAGARGAGR
jgi:hypothetical protein